MPIKIEKSTHFPLVQSLRGLAAMWVVLFHAAEGRHIDSLLSKLPTLVADIVFRAGHLGVPIFFALSGFVIAHSLRDVPLSGRVFARFALRRSIRLDPPYWASIILVLAMAYLSAKVKHEPFSMPEVSVILAHLFYLQEILGFKAISPVYWTLTFEFQFYLFFAGLLSLAASVRFGRTREVMWLIFELLAVVAASGGFFWVAPGVFVTLWPAFFVGVLAYKAIDSVVARVGLGLVIVPILLRQDHLALASALTSLFLLMSTIWGFATRKPRFLLGQRLGAISYSLYLIHGSLSGALGFVAHKIFGTSALADSLVLIVIVAGCVIGAAIFYWAIELPTHRLTKKIKLV